MRRALVSLLLVLVPSVASAAAQETRELHITYWTGMNWYGLYSSYGEKSAELDQAVYRASLALRKGEAGAVAELKPVVEAGCTDPTVLLMYGYLMSRAGDLAAACDVLAKGAASAAQPARPEWVRTWVRGACLQWQAYLAADANRYGEALNLARMALGAFPSCPDKDELANNIPALESVVQTKQETEKGLSQAASVPGLEGARKVLEVLSAGAARNFSPYNNLPGTANGRRADDWYNHHKWMDFPKALPASEAVLAGYPDDPNVVRLHHLILAGLKRWNEAEEFGVKAISIVQKSGDKEYLFWMLFDQIRTVLDDDLASPTPEHTKALHKYNCGELADRCAALADELNNDNLRFRAYSIQANCTDEAMYPTNTNERSIELYKKALTVAEKNGWTDRARDAISGIVSNLAAAGKDDESVAWSRKAGLSPHPWVIEHRKQWQPLYEQDKASIDAYEQMTVREPTERLQREVVGWNQRGAYDGTILACANLGKFAAAVETAERLQNRTLGMILGAKIEQGKVSSLAKRKESQSQLKSRVDTLNRQLALAQQTSDTADMESARRDLKVQSVALQELSSDIAADELEISDAKMPPRLALRDMQNLIPGDAAVLMYHAPWSPMTKEGFIALLAEKQFKFCRVQGLVADALFPMIEAYNKAIQTPAPGPEPTALRNANDALYALLLKPVADDIRAHKRLVLILSGPLVQVPIHLLQDPAGHPLLEEHSVSYAPSFGALKYALARNRKVGGKVTVVANPALPEQGASLKFAEVEAEEIRKVYPSANVLMGDRATETAVKAALTSADILHFACHGLLDTQEPMKSALALTPDDQNDGMLTAREICDYPVKAGLVVLSSCESGSGGMSAGWIELVGMSRAWLLAGTPSVVVSLWKLDDKATSELMGEFYSNLTTMGRAEALQQAQLAMMKKYENPYYWGAFVLYGDYR